MVKEKMVKEKMVKEKMIKEIIEGDKIEELQKLISKKGIQAISPITKSFNEVEKMEIPIIHECIIKKATKCFKFLLINEIEDPTITMQEQIQFPFYEKLYAWDCMGVALNSILR